MVRYIGEYPVTQLESMLRLEQRQLLTEITSLRRQLSGLQRRLDVAEARLEELNAAETLLRS